MIQLEDLARRLSALGDQPVDPEVAARHMAMLASLEPVEVPRRLVRPALAGALLAGTLIGGVAAGALTGALPDPAQGALHGALAKVGVSVPDGDEDSGGGGKGDGNGAESSAADAAAAADANSGGAEPGAQGERRTADVMGTDRVNCGPFTGNHGQWVVAQPDRPGTPINEREEAAKSDCGKPQAAVEHRPHQGPGGPSEAGKPADPGRPDGAGRPGGAGRPEGAGKPGGPGQAAPTSRASGLG